MSEMKKCEKIDYLVNNHFFDWLNTRTKVDNELSDKQGMFCMCGRLATGMHESNCTRFRNKVDTETIKRLEHLISEGGKNEPE